MERYARFAGSWYPAGKDELMPIAECPMRDGESRFAVLPHSGLMFSSTHIREYFSSLSDAITRILIISPSHYYYLEPDMIVSARFTSSATPIGNIETMPMNVGTVSENALQREHGVEMFLPFIAAKKGMKVSYLLLSSLSSEKSGMMIADKILSLIDEHTGVIASSDFTHYGPSYDFMPYGKDAYGRIMAEDDRTADLLANGEAEEAWREGKERTICGIAPAAVVSAMAKRIGLEGKRGLGSSSADTTGDRENFVSYRTVLWR